MKKYLPTPKVMAAIVIGALATVVVTMAEAYDLATVRAEAASVLVLALSVIGAWLTRDKSSPDGKSKGSKNQHHNRTDS